MSTILKFSAAWCVPCKVLEEQLTNYNSLHDIITYDAEEDADKFEDYSVRNVPTLIFLDQDGNELARRVGSTSLAQFEDWINTVENGVLEI